MCILLVEDEWLIRELFAEELIVAGFEVREAADGDRAAALIEAQPDYFSLLVTDIHMPGGLDGIGVARMLRTRRPDIPLIYMTARPDALNGRWPLGTRDHLLRKPFAFPKLLSAVRLLLDEGNRRVR